MKVHLEQATSEHVQTFVRELEPEEHLVAAELGWLTGVEGMYSNLLERSAEAFALVTYETHGPYLMPPQRVISMLGVLRGPAPARLWLHMPPVFKSGGFGALRVARLLIDRLLGEHGELCIDVEASKPDVVRMADWLGFKHLGFTEKLGRVFHRCVLRLQQRRVA